jgi:hypothetical protein
MGVKYFYKGDLFKPTRSEKDLAGSSYTIVNNLCSYKVFF